MNKDYAVMICGEPIDDFFTIGEAEEYIKSEAFKKVMPDVNEKDLWIAKWNDFYGWINGINKYEEQFFIKE